jgi:hypothetical protein
VFCQEFAAARSSALGTATFAELVDDPVGTLLRMRLSSLGGGRLNGVKYGRSLPKMSWRP